MDEIREQQIKIRFGERVRANRKQKALSQEALALVCDLDRSYIGGVERGERNISYGHRPTHRTFGGSWYTVHIAIPTIIQHG